MKTLPRNTVRVGLFFLFVIALVCLPFIIFGEDFVFPLLQSRQQQTGALMLIAIVLLICDSVAPVPATLVIWFLAEWGGLWAGIAGGTIGLALGVVAAGWFGRDAVGRLAPKFMSDEELGRLRESLQRRLVLTLACLRSVPVMAETSIIVATATGIPIRRVFWATLLPNFVVASIYSVAAHYSVGRLDSFVTAIVTFILTMGVSYAAWRVFGVRK